MKFVARNPAISWTTSRLANPNDLVLYEMERPNLELLQLILVSFHARSTTTTAATPKSSSNCCPFYQDAFSRILATFLDQVPLLHWLVHEEGIIENPTDVLMLCLQHSQPPHVWRWLLDDTTLPNENGASTAQLHVCATNANGSTALHWACATGHTANVHCLLHEYNADPRARDDDDETPLHVACRCNSPSALETVRVLLDYDRSMLLPCTTETETTTTPLHIATMYDHVNIVRLLLEYADADDDAAATVDHDDKQKQHYQSVSTLLHAVDTTDGHTALHVACQYGCIDVARVLLQHQRTRTKDSSLINQQSHNGWTALHWASRYGYAELVELLISTPGVHTNVQGGTATERSLLLYDDVLVDEIELRQAEQQLRGETPLHLAAKYGQFSVAQLLVDRGQANIRIRDDRGQTAWDVAVALSSSRSVTTTTAADVAQCPCWRKLLSTDPTKGVVANSTSNVNLDGTPWRWARRSSTSSRKSC